MTSTIIAAAVSLCVVSLAAVATADTLILSNGTRVNGTVVKMTGRTITFKDDAGTTRQYDANQIDSLRFLSTDRYAATSGRNSSGARVQRLGTLPSGTQLDIRTAEAIDSSTASVNQTFSAVVEHDITGDSNEVIVPAGSRAVLVVRALSSGGATSSPDIVLDVQSLTVGGRRYLVSTADLKEDSGTGIGSNKRTAETVGGGAALGTLIGAIAGGAKGAAIGVLVGAAGGAGVQVLNKGKDLRVPAETLLGFRLDRPVSLQADR